MYLWLAESLKCSSHHDINLILNNQIPIISLEVANFPVKKNHLQNYTFIYKMYIVKKDMINDKYSFRCLD